MPGNSAAILEELRSILKDIQESFKKLAEEVEEMKKLQVEMMEVLIGKSEKTAEMKIGSKFVKTGAIDLKIMEKWSEFTPEIKINCIRRMDLETRLNLRRTARTEKTLVDSCLSIQDL